MDSVQLNQPTTITRAAYERAVANGCAGPLSTLATDFTRDRYETLGADGWQVAWEEGLGTVLRPVRIQP